MMIQSDRRIGKGVVVAAVVGLVLYFKPGSPKSHTP
jgi:hypothetical protein